MEEQDVLLEVSDRVAWVILNRPQARNAMRSKTSIELISTFRELAGREDVGCAVIRGAGDVAFCAGHDLKEEGGRYRGSKERTEEVERMTTVVEHMVTLPIPTIAAVKGYVRGGGNWLMASCDIAIAAEDATFGFPQMNFGSFEFVPMVPVIRRIGRGKTVDLLFSCDVIDAREAKAIGYIDRLVPVEGFWQTVQEVAQKIAGRDPQAVKAGKEALRLLTDMDLVKQLRTMKNAQKLHHLMRHGQEATEQIERHIAAIHARPR